MTNNVGGRAPGRRLHVLAPAKLNLTLEVVGRRADGYHLLESVMQSIDIADVVSVAPAGPPSDPAAAVAEAVVGDGGKGDPGVPNGEANLAARAVAALKAAAEAEGASVAGDLPPLHIEIDKHIPVAAGLGGGSADAAAALLAANELWGLQWSRERLAAVGLTVGADVPFCLLGGTAVARGVGEELTAVAPAHAERWAGVVLNPGFPVSTAEVYRRYSEGNPLGSDGEGGRTRAEAMVRALREGRPAAAAAGLFNALEPVTTRMHPEVGGLRRRLLQAGALGAVMCGSGPSVFGLARDAEHAAVLAARLAADGVAPYVGIARFLSRGSRVLAAERPAR